MTCTLTVPGIGAKSGVRNLAERNELHMLCFFFVTNETTLALREVKSLKKDLSQTF